MPFGGIELPRWDDRDLFIIGGGDSLLPYDLSCLRERGRVLGINRAPKLVPCDAWHSIDYMYLRLAKDEIQGFVEAGLECYAAVGETWFDSEGHKPIAGVHYLKRTQGEGITAGPGTLVNGCNSGYTALCLAVLKGARRIYLLGFDMKGDNTHWHPGYEWAPGRTSIYFPRWAARFAEIKQNLPSGCKVLNCNPFSGITAFPFTSYDTIGIPRRQKWQPSTGAPSCKPLAQP